MQGVQANFEEFGFISPVFILRSQDGVVADAAFFSDEKSKDDVANHIVTLIRKLKASEVTFICEAWVTEADQHFNPKGPRVSKVVIIHETKSGTSIWLADTIGGRYHPETKASIGEWEGETNKTPAALQSLSRFGNLLARAYSDQN